MLGTPTHQGSADFFVLAGGKGTRLREATGETTKLLAPIDPDGTGPSSMIVYTLCKIIESDPRSITVLTSTDEMAQADDVEETVYSWASDVGYTNVLASRSDHEKCGTALEIRQAMGKQLVEDRSVITPADTLFPYNKIPNAVSEHNQTGAFLTWCTTSVPGEHAQNEGKIIIDRARGIVDTEEDGNACYPAEPEDLTRVTSAGVLIVEPKRYIQYFDAAFRDMRPVALYSSFLPKVIRESRLSVRSYDIREPVVDLGIPERYYEYGFPRESSI